MDIKYMVDSHLDIAWNAKNLNRDFLTSIDDWHETPEIEKTFGERLVSLPDLLAAGHRLIIATIYVMPEKALQVWNINPDSIKHYTTPAEAFVQGWEQLEYYKEVAARDDRVEIIYTAEQLNHFVANLDKGPKKLGILLSMEGADPIEQPEQLAKWADGGLRLVGPAWSGTRYSGGTWEPGPLTPDGFKLLVEMQRLGVMLDVSHMAEESFYQAMDAYQGTVIASHSNCRHFVNTDRQLTDDMIKRLVERQAVIGCVLFNLFLTGSSKADLEDVKRHIYHVCDIAGNSLSVGLGCDWDGGYSKEWIPAPLKGLSDIPMLAEALLRDRFSEEDVLNLFHRNWVRILGQGLANRDAL